MNCQALGVTHAFPVLPTTRNCVCARCPSGQLALRRQRAVGRARARERQLNDAIPGELPRAGARRGHCRTSHRRSAPCVSTPRCGTGVNSRLKVHSDAYRRHHSRPYDSPVAATPELTALEVIGFGMAISFGLGSPPSWQCPFMSAAVVLTIVAKSALWRRVIQRSADRSVSADECWFSRCWPCWACSLQPGSPVDCSRTR
jgi:hypothetical protein